jgi:tRNA U34 5-methylaminomethyl-2-thiouridine-forming methyltransferase MnmC
MSGDYKLVTLINATKTLFSSSYGEKMHPGLGPQSEAELLYVRQLNIREHLQNHSGGFVIWDIGLGAAANAITALRATRDIAGQVRIVSFDNTCEPLEFALEHSAALGYIAGYEKDIAELLRSRRVEFQNGKSAVIWELHLGDFPTWLDSGSVGRVSPRAESENPVMARGDTRPTRRMQVRLAPARGGGATCESTRPTNSPPPPHAIFYDPFSPAKNPAMWTLPLFENLFRALDPARRCALTTYSRSTFVRATLLLAGFFVGSGHATGSKEETTIAANHLELIAEPLDLRWLNRAARSDSAEPLLEPVYRRQKLSAQTLERLRRHPQFDVAVDC